MTKPNLKTPDHPHHQIISTTQLAPILAVQSKNATVVVVETPWGIQVAGESKREPGDRQNYARGYRLALGRALVNLGRAVEREERKAIRRETIEANQRTLANLAEYVGSAAKERDEADSRHAELAKKYGNTPEARAKRRERALRRLRDEGAQIEWAK